MSERAKSFIAKVAKGGKITIPHEIRELLGVERGILVEATVKKAEPL